MRAGRRAEADRCEKNDDQEWRHDEKGRYLSFCTRARQPHQINDRQTYYSNRKSELQGEKYQRAGGREVGADTQAKKRDAERCDDSGAKRQAKRA
jgi:hypothetical protein